jgi:hypothetical protein
MKSCNFWRLIFNKVTSRSYGHFLKFSYLFWQKNGFLQVGQKLQKLVKKTEGILGVKLLAKGDRGFLDREYSLSLHMLRKEMRTKMIRSAPYHYRCLGGMGT